METLKEISVDLSNVAVEDQQLVKDVCAVVATIRKDVSVSDIQVAVVGKVYHVVAGFPKGAMVEVTKAELETISDVNPLRVACVSVFCDGTQVYLKIRVCSMDHPVTVTETTLVRIVKKRKWFGSIV